MWIDTHCHLDAPEFAGQESRIARDAEKTGIRQIVIPSIKSASFGQVAALAHTCNNCSYALGIHPIYVADSSENDLEILDKALEKGMADPRLVAIGEIGLDFYVPELARSPLREKQEHFLEAQLKMARKYELPVFTAYPALGRYRSETSSQTENPSGNRACFQRQFPAGRSFH